MSNCNLLDQINLKYSNAKGQPHHNYFPYYESELLLVKIPIKTILEIGVQDGQSLQIWKERWPEARIFGIDIEGEKNHIEGTKVFTGRQEDPLFIAEEIIPNGPFDLIIDDGSHKSEHFLASLYFLWPFLNPGGLYIVEDIVLEEALSFSFTGSVLDSIESTVRVVPSTEDWGKSNLQSLKLVRGDRRQFLLILKKREDEQN